MWDMSPNYVHAYAGAFIARAQDVLGVNYGDRETLEWHSFNLFNYVDDLGRGAAKGMGCYKPRDHAVMFVKHLSGYEVGSHPVVH